MYQKIIKITLSENIQDNQKMTGMNLNEAAFIIFSENIQDNQKMTGMNSNEAGLS